MTAAKAAAIASHAPEHRDKGGRLAALFPNTRRLAVEAVVIAALIALAAFLVYHFTVHKIVNHRPLGGVNVDVSNVDFDQSQTAFAVDPTNPRHLFGATNDTGLEVLRVYESSNDGRTWTQSHGPVVAGGSCAHGAPRVAFGPDGREYVTFLAAPYCGDSLTPYLVVTSRPGPSEKWAPLTRVATKKWKYGFDDAPDIAVDTRSGRVALVWTQGVSKHLATTVTSTSDDHARTWSAPEPTAGLDHPHLARVAVAPDGTVYTVGIDAKLGLWAQRGNGRPVTAAKLIANPAGGCAQTAGDPLPKEQTACEGPDPTVSVTRKGVTIVYGDVGANGTPDIYAVTLTRDLKPVARVQVSPVEKKKTLQLLPTSTVDPTTGTLWACWYDTTFDPNQHRVWFTCSASRDGRVWAPPVRAASDPTDATIFYGTLGKAGLYASVSARNGVAHAFWADGRVINNSSDVFTAAIRERTALTQRG